MADTVAVIGGTGKLGSAIGRRLARAGRKVIIGSRSAQSRVTASCRPGWLAFTRTRSALPVAVAQANVFF